MAAELSPHDEAPGEDWPDLAASARFYLDGLGLDRLGGFQDHQGFDGFMAGLPDWPFHLELTFEHGCTRLPPASPEDLLVFYVSEAAARDRLDLRMRALGFAPVVSTNPYWEACGRTYADPDGYRVVVAAPPR